MNQKSWVWLEKWILLGAVCIHVILSSSQIGCSLIVWSHGIDGVCSGSVSENGKFIAVGCEDGFYYIFDDTGRLIGKGNVPAPAVSIDIANSGDCIIGSGSGFTLCNKMGDHISSFVSFNVNNVSISDSGTYSLVCSQGNLYINQNASMVVQLQIADMTPFGVISSDGNIACAASNETLYFYSEGSFTDPITLKEPVNALILSDTGQTVCVMNDRIGIVSQDGTVEYMDMNVTITSISASIETGTYVITHTDSITWMEKGITVFEKRFEGPVHVLDLSEDAGYAVVRNGEKTIVLLTNRGDICFTHEFNSNVEDAYITEGLLIVYTPHGIYCFRLYDVIKSNTNFFPFFSRKSLPLSSFIEESWSYSIDGKAAFLTGDPDGDGHAEIIVQENARLLLLDENGLLEEERNLEIPFVLCPLLDVDGDCISEIPLLFQHSIYTFTIYDWKTDHLHDFFLNSVREYPSQTGQARPFMILNGDTPVIVTSLSAGYSCQPRGVIAVDSESGEILWEYRTGPSVIPDVVDDIDGDGAPEIIIGSAAPCNCPEDEFYPDCEAFIIALSAQGEKVWSLSVGTGYKRVSVISEDILENPGKEIIGFCYEASENWGRLLCLSSTGEIMHDIHEDYSIFPGAVGDIDGDGIMEIITLDSQGYLRIYTPHLEMKGEVYIDENVTSNAHVLITDINGDGVCDILFWHEKTLIIFNRELTVMWENQWNTTIRADILLTSGCKNLLLVLSDHLSAYSFQGPGETPCPLWEITSRNLSEKALAYESEGESLLSSGKYWNSKEKFQNAREIYSQLHDEEKGQVLSLRIETISHSIFKDTIKKGIWVLSLVSGIALAVLCYFWIVNHQWYQSCEQIILMFLPSLFGLSQIYVTPTPLYFSLFVENSLPLLLLSSVILLRENILRFVKIISTYVRGHKDMLVLSISQSNSQYSVSVESIEERFNPVKESQKIPLSPQEKRELVEKIPFIVEVLHQVPQQGPEFLTHAQELLQESGKMLYEKVIPTQFADILNTSFLLLEVEDTDIPWELMHSHEFFALHYAISRRMVSTESVTIRPAPSRKEKRALIISDPLENLEGASTECTIIQQRLHKKMDTVIVEGTAASVRRVAHLLGQGFDIIHYAGHIDNGLVLSDGYLGCKEVREFLVGRPIVVMNGCKSEDLTKAFLLGGAKVYVATIHPIHDTTAAEIAADFYDLCFHHQIGEALRKARKLHASTSITWASLIMYGDPTLTLW